MAPQEESKSMVEAMWTVYQSLRAAGWREIEFCPKDGSVFEAIEVGSAGIHDCHYEGEWPKGYWWVHEANDLWPSHPILFRLKEKDR